MTLPRRGASPAVSNSSGTGDPAAPPPRRGASPAGSYLPGPCDTATSPPRCLLYLIQGTHAPYAGSARTICRRRTHPMQAPHAPYTCCDQNHILAQGQNRELLGFSQLGSCVELTAVRVLSSQLQRPSRRRFSRLKFLRRSFGVKSLG